MEVDIPPHPRNIQAHNSCFPLVFSVFARNNLGLGESTCRLPRCFKMIGALQGGGPYDPYNRSYGATVDGFVMGYLGL